MGTGVSILVLVDAALRQVCLLPEKTTEVYVSILVLVDAALRLFLPQDTCISSTVSILVLVDAALRQF